MLKLVCVFALLQTSWSFTTNYLNISANNVPTVSPQYAVSIKQRSLYDDDEFRHFCTGSILGKQWILTAGHCLSDKTYNSVDDFAVDVGSEDLNGGTRYRVAEFYVHPNESESVIIFRNDIALIKLKDSIDFNSRVGPVHLGTINDQAEVPVLSGGWGRISDNGPVAKTIRYLQFTTMKYNKCQELHKPKNNLVDRDTQICGFGGIGRKICFGDSGGPLMSVKTGYQVGVFSSLEDCTGKYPTLFMRIESFIDWINDVTKLELTLD